MIRVDTVKIYAPADVLTEFNKRAFEQQQTFFPDGRIKENKHVSYCADIAGLKRITVNEKTNELTVEMSAKVLKNDYFELININTIGQVFDTINSSNIIAVDASRISEFKAHSVDFTKNIKCDYTPQQIIDTCRLVNSSRHIIESYKGSGDNKHKTGIVFRGRQKSFRERLIIYDKHAELIKDKKLLSHISRPLLFSAKYANVTRVEMNVTSHAKIREYTKTDNVLLDILKSTETPLFRLYKKVIADNFIQTDLFSDYAGFKLYEIEKRLGRETIIKDLNFDYELIRSFIHKYVKGNIARYLKEYRAVMYEMQTDHSAHIQNQKVIIEFENQLKAA